MGSQQVKDPNKYGKENVLFFLTANTSASYPVDYLQEEFNLPVDNLTSKAQLLYLLRF